MMVYAPWAPSFHTATDSTASSPKSVPTGAAPAAAPAPPASGQRFGTPPAPAPAPPMSAPPAVAPASLSAAPAAPAAPTPAFEPTPGRGLVSWGPQAPSSHNAARQADARRASRIGRL